MSESWETEAAELHPYMVDSIAALPASLRTAATTAMPPGATVQRGLFVPSDVHSEEGGDAQLTGEQALLFTDRGVLHVQSGVDGQPSPAPSFVQPQNLLYLRSSHLLLYGRLELVSAVAGQPHELQMEFNAVGWRLMGEEWRDLVRTVIGAQGLEAAATAQDAVQVGESLPHKFVDGLYRYGLYTGETLLGVVFQPAIWEQHSSSFDEQLVPNTLLALTGHSVLLLQEEPALVRDSEQFGLIVMRLLLEAIHAIDNAMGRSGEEIIFSLARNGATAEAKLLLGSEAAQEWLHLWRQQGA